MTGGLRRWVLAVLVCAAVVGLVAWQRHRAGLIAACVADGGVWTGSSCGPAPHAPILQRDLRRT